MLTSYVRLLPVTGFAALAGCAGLQFNDAPKTGAFTYYEPQPFLVVKQAADCTFTSDIISLPGAKRSVGFTSGIGSAKLSIKTANGIITEVGQDTDTKIPETVTALTGLAKQLGVGIAAVGAAPGTCAANVSLHAITTDGNGVIKVDPTAAFSK